MKWVKKGFLNYRFESEDGKWVIYHDEFGSVACKRKGTNKGWYLGCRSLGDTAIQLAEAKIAKYTER